jgi:hypothetical protein
VVANLDKQHADVEEIVMWITGTAIARNRDAGDEAYGPSR